MVVPDAAIGEAHKSRFAWDTLTELTEIGDRMAGQPGEAKGAQVMMEAFERAGTRKSTITEFPISGWCRGSSSLSVRTETRETEYHSAHEVIALPGTPATSVEGELVDVGAGLPSDFDDETIEGRIALVGSQNPPEYGRAINRIEKYARAVDQGAVAFIYHNAVVDGGVPPTGAVGFGHDFPAEIPAIGVSREVGAKLKRYLRSGSVSAELSIDCRTEDATSRNVEAVVGPDRTPEILVTAHIDAHDLAEGARDNGVGCAIVAEVGRILARAEDELETKVRLIVFGGEELGLFGSKHWASTHELADVAGFVYVDGIGFNRDLLVTGLGPLARAFQPVERELNVPIETASEVHPFSDTWPFISSGIPCIRCVSTGGDEGQVTRYGGQDWGHTHGDTLDKLDPRDIRDLTIQIAGGVSSITGQTDRIDRLERGTVQDHIPPDLADYLRLDDRWPW